MQKILILLVFFDYPYFFLSCDLAPNFINSFNIIKQIKLFTQEDSKPMSSKYKHCLPHS
ncbi:hypothetical protein CCUN_1882 [Campylobacter cuniculorum DSM 23162 = LMG 24588]|uniref:Uncharacterized protein n=1 Tax=Campylobacter cuniculorum DSM 23162 = LMG 24588 TaxID=1121267 RepID=A0A1W6BZB2_9BACT|nr:hypothetical protein CCUN_1882 [Campylobacter cuniculorum DSM 23162 = LMG 24588]